MSPLKTNPTIENALNTMPPWVGVLNADPRKDLVECQEPFTRYRTLIDILDIPQNDAVAITTQQAVLEISGVQQLVENLPKDWTKYLVKGHDKVDYPPSVVLLLFDFGVSPDDFPQINSLLEQMKSNQDEDGRFLSLARFPGKPPMVGSSLCDTHIITEVLLLGGHKGTTEVHKALDFITAQLKETNQGFAWKCEPNSMSKARGPGKKDDICPQVTLEALRLFSLLPESERPMEVIAAGKTLLGCWDRRKTERPYIFGQGTRFKKLRPPFFWYNIGEVLDTTSRYPELVREESFQEMLSLVVEKADPKGRFTPESIYRDFKNWSFGQKNVWSPWTTFYLCRILKRVYG